MSIETGSEPARRVSAGRFGLAFTGNAGIRRRSLPILAAAVLASTMLLPITTRAVSVLPESRDGLHQSIDRKALLQEAKRALLAQATG
jgi:hypothetical protein